MCPLTKTHKYYIYRSIYTQLSPFSLFFCFCYFLADFCIRRTRIISLHFCMYKIYENRCTYMYIIISAKGEWLYRTLFINLHVYSIANLLCKMWLLQGSLGVHLHCICENKHYSILIFVWVHAYLKTHWIKKRYTWFLEIVIKKEKFLGIEPTTAKTYWHLRFPWSCIRHLLLSM